jgi:NTP pyrophosphatase (non-canonical NTP hydrolase)
VEEEAPKGQDMSDFSFEAFSRQAEGTARYLEPVGGLVSPAKNNNAVYLGESIEIAAQMYCALGLSGESGECADKVKKLFRDRMTMSGEERRALIDDIHKEIGDVLWYLSELARLTGTSLAACAQMNNEKLRKRQEAGTIHGRGDNR